MRFEHNLSLDIRIQELHHIHNCFLFVKLLCKVSNYRGFQVACQNDKCQVQNPLTLTNQ